MLDLIKPALGQTGIDFAELRGDTTDRKRPVARFQEGKVPLFLISLKAGGTGLNLTAADTVIHYDPWWNPAVEDQATDRAHRIGQDKPVFVYKLVAQGTVEERMLDLQQRKKALAAGIFEAGVGAAAVLEAADIERLFEPLGVTNVFAETGNNKGVPPAPPKPGRAGVNQRGFGGQPASRE
jgi:SNF2 family DNA or RNA helicase